MAQTLSVPIQLKFNVERAKWLAGRIKLHSWRLSYSGGWAMKASISHPAEFSGDQDSIEVEWLPANVREQLPPDGTRLSSPIRSIEVDVLLCAPPSDGWKPSVHSVDPWRLRQEFLLLKRPRQELLKFLNKYGTWARYSMPRFDASDLEHLKPKVVLPDRIWGDQEAIRQALKLDATSWFTGHRGGLDLSTQPDFPHLVHHDSTCLDAIRTANTIDFLRGVRFKICAREDCGTPFPADRKGKRYCQQYCAHLTSVRKNRKHGTRQKGA